MVPCFIFAVFSVVFAVVVIFAIVTTVRHAPGTRAGSPAIRVG
jgi:uncharacterized membrane protein